MDETGSVEKPIPPELFCEIVRERAWYIGMDAVSRSVQIAPGILRIINSTDDELLLLRRRYPLRTDAELDRLSSLLAE